MWARPSLWWLLRMAWDELSGARERREIRAMIQRSRELIARADAAKVRR